MRHFKSHSEADSFFSGMGAKPSGTNSAGSLSRFSPQRRLLQSQAGSLRGYQVIKMACAGRKQERSLWKEERERANLNMSEIDVLRF
jgi:hypothetical protein